MICDGISGSISVQFVEEVVSYFLLPFDEEVFLSEVLEFGDAEFEDNQEEDLDGRYEEDYGVGPLFLQDHELHFLAEKGAHQSLTDPVESDADDNDDGVQQFDTRAHGQNFAVDNDDDDAKEKGSAELEVADGAGLVQNSSFHEFEGDQHGDDAVQKGQPNSFEEGVLIELLIVDAGLIQIVSVVGFLSGVLLVEEGVEDDGQAGVEDVVELVDEAVEEDYA